MRHHALEASFDRVSATISPTVGLAVATEAEVFALGRWSTGVAWSTIKVPLAIAALRNDPRRAIDLAVAAIEQSDNASAESLWSQLGEPPKAAAKVQAVIAECGDGDTVVQSQRLRRGYTAFGQTQWTLSRQAQFAAHLRNISGAGHVVGLMQNLTHNHRWGLASKGFAAKGGWGPGTDGSYLARQFANIPTESGSLGVALAAEAHDGGFGDAKAALDTLADWLVGHLPDLTEQ